MIIGERQGLVRRRVPTALHPHRTTRKAAGTDWHACSLVWLTYSELLALWQCQLQKRQPCGGFSSPALAGTSLVLSLAVGCIIGIKSLTRQTQPTVTELATPFTVTVVLLHCHNCCLTCFAMHSADTVTTFVHALLLSSATSQLLSGDTSIAAFGQASLQKPLAASPKAPFTRNKLQAPRLCPSYGESQWTGFITVSDDRDLFYWYFDSRNDPENDPIIVDFPGGPGVSGLPSVLGTNGPCLFQGDKSEPNPWSLNNNASVLFLDQPAPAGFSHLADGAPLPTNDQEAAKDFQRFLQLFFADAFPEKQHLPIHIKTASYGGHYGPVYLDHILESRRNGSDTAFRGDIRSLILHDAQIDWTATFVGTYPILCENEETAGLLNATACEYMAANMPEQKRLGHECQVAYNGGRECKAAYTYGVDVIQAPYTDLRLDLGDCKLLNSILFLYHDTNGRYYFASPQRVSRRVFISCLQTSRCRNYEQSHESRLGQEGPWCAIRIPVHRMEPGNVAGLP